MYCFNKRLKILRETKKMTQPEMANLFSVSLRSYQRYEHGDRVPKLYALYHVANCLSVSVDWLLGLSDKMKLLKVIIKGRGIDA